MDCPKKSEELDDLALRTRLAEKLVDFSVHSNPDGPRVSGGINYNSIDRVIQERERQRNYTK